jgi:hypothetical protein
LAKGETSALKNTLLAKLRLSRTGITVVAFGAAALALMSLSAAVAVWLTLPPEENSLARPLPPASLQAIQLNALVDRALALEEAGESARADGMLEGLKLLAGPMDHKRAVERVVAIRNQRTADPSKAPDPPGNGQGDPQPAPKASTSAQAPGQADGARRPPQGAAKRPARGGAASAKAKPSRMNIDQAREQFSSAVQLRKEGKLLQAVKVLEDILARADPGDGRTRAEAALPRYRKALEDSR